jgi:hypothetical protein
MGEMAVGEMADTPDAGDGEKNPSGSAKKS